MLEAPPAKAYERTAPHRLVGASILVGLLVVGLLAIEHPLVVGTTIGALIGARWLGRRLSAGPRRRGVFGHLEDRGRPRVPLA